MRKTGMRGMILFFLLLTGACKPGDRSLMNGTWSIAEVRIDGQIVFSDDEAVMTRVIDSMLSVRPELTNGFFGNSKEEVRERVQREMRKMGEMKLEIKKDRSYEFSAMIFGDKQVETGTTVTDESKKELLMKGKNVNAFTYEVSGSRLKLINKRRSLSNRELIFKRI